MERKEFQASGTRSQATSESAAAESPAAGERLAPLVGSRRHGAGKTRAEIDAEVRELRGPREE